MTDIQEYFQRVVALSPGTFFSVHYKNPGGGIPGKAFQDFADAEKAALAWSKRGLDVYLAMGAQKDCGIGNAAIRQKHNTIHARCLYMDIDVKSDAYPTTNEAVTAFKSFVTWASLPPPTALVRSGTGGFHVYWSFPGLITPDEHFKLSSQLSQAARDFGLKFDSACTMDLTRLLRVPDTKNFKHTPPLDVKLVHAGSEVDLDLMRNALSSFKFVAPKSNSQRVSSPNDDLRGGQTYVVPTIDSVANVCPFLKETLDSGGANLVDDPQWHAMAALSCHCVDPSATIHRLCSKSSYYKHDDTEAKLAQAQSYRSQNPQLGPPKCVSLKNVGAPHCATCPHLALGTTPLALPFVLPKQIPETYIFSDIPVKYSRNKDNHIYLEETAEDEAKTEQIIVFPYAILPNSGYLESGRPFRLTFMTEQGKEVVQKTFDAPAFSDDVSFKKAMLVEGLPISANVSKGRGFFMDYIRLLQSKKETMIRVPALGWEFQGGVWGFAYDGEFVTPEGKFPCKRPEKAVAEYRAIGTDKAWRDMAAMVLTKNRPDLMILAATAFSAPLVKMSGQNGYLIGAWSSASGIGKTTALKLSQSVWAPPEVGGFTDTVNYTFSKCANVRDLPVIYDEVKGDIQTADFVKLVLQITVGKEKGRSDRAGNMRETKTWHTNIPYASNSSIVSGIAETTTGTHASVYRVFEFEAINLPNANLTTDLAELSTQLSTNHGCIGKIYAEFLGKNYEKLDTQLRDIQRKLERDLFAQGPERCWIAAMSTTLFGAALAKSLGLAPFDIPLMKQFMVKEFHRMRNDQRISVGDYTNPDAIYNELALFMAERRKNVVITDKAWTTASRPPKDYAKILNDKLQWDEIGIQISGSPLTLRVRETFLGKWCRENKRQKHALAQAMLKLPGVTRNKARLASGTRLADQDEYIFIIPVTGTPMEDRCEYAIQYKDLQP